MSHKSPVFWKNLGAAMWGMPARRMISGGSVLPLFSGLIVSAMLFPPGRLQAAEDAGEGKGSIRLLQEIYRQRSAVRTQGEEAKERLQRASAKLGIAQRRYQELNARARAARVRAVNLDARFRWLESQCPSNEIEGTQLDAMRRDVREQYDLCEKEYAEIESQGAETASSIAGLRKQIIATQAEIVKVRAEADQLRKEWFAARDSLGKLSRVENEELIKLCSEWIADPSTHDPCVYWMRGMAYLDLGKYVSAVGDFNKISQLEPQIASTAIAARGLAMCRSGEMNRGMRDFVKAVEMDKTNGLPFLWRGIVHREQKDYSRAGNDFKSALRLMPGNVTAQEGLALLMAAAPNGGLRNSKQALKHAMNANKISNGKDWTCLRTLAAAHAEHGDFKAALEYARLAADVAPKEKEVSDALQEQIALYKKESPYRLP